MPSYTITEDVVPPFVETIHEPEVEDFLKQALETAKEAAREAGDYLQKKRGNVEIVSKKASRDYLLDADLRAEQIIIDKLQKAFPNYEILSEETRREMTDAPYQWIVDPLDGSANFQHGNPTFAVSIGLRIDNAMTIAVIYIPFSQEMFTAILKHGAYLNDESIKVSDTSVLNDAIVHVGDFAKDGNRRDNKEQLEDMAQLANAVGRVRMIGTAATDLAYVACGRADAFIVHKIPPWDIDIGRLLVTEAGGQITYRRSEWEPDRYLAVCSNSFIHQQMLELIPEETRPRIQAYRSGW